MIRLKILVKQNEAVAYQIEGNAKKNNSEILLMVGALDRIKHHLLNEYLDDPISIEEEKK